MERKPLVASDKIILGRISLQPRLTFFPRRNWKWFLRTWSSFDGSSGGLHISSTAEKKTKKSDRRSECENCFEYFSNYFEYFSISFSPPFDSTFVCIQRIRDNIANYQQQISSSLFCFLFSIFFGLFQLSPFLFFFFVFFRPLPLIPHSSGLNERIITQQKISSLFIFFFSLFFQCFRFSFSCFQFLLFLSLPFLVFFTSNSTFVWIKRVHNYIAHNHQQIAFRRSSVNCGNHSLNSKKKKENEKGEKNQLQKILIK